MAVTEFLVNLALSQPNNPDRDEALTTLGPRSPFSNPSA